MESLGVGVPEQPGGAPVQLRLLARGAASARAASRSRRRFTHGTVRSTAASSASPSAEDAHSNGAVSRGTGRPGSTQATTGTSGQTPAERLEGGGLRRGTPTTSTSGAPSCRSSSSGAPAQPTGARPRPAARRARSGRRRGRPPPRAAEGRVPPAKRPWDVTRRGQSSIASGSSALKTKRAGPRKVVRWRSAGHPHRQPSPGEVHRDEDVRRHPARHDRRRRPTRRLPSRRRRSGPSLAPTPRPGARPPRGSPPRRWCARESPAGARASVRARAPPPAGHRAGPDAGLPMLTAVPGQSTPGTGARRRTDRRRPARAGGAPAAGPGRARSPPRPPRRPRARPRREHASAGLHLHARRGQGSRSRRCFTTQRSPLPHISATLPSALCTTIRAAARLEGRSTSTPSAPTPRAPVAQRSGRLGREVRARGAPVEHHEVVAQPLVLEALLDPAAHGSPSPGRRGGRARAGGTPAAHPPGPPAGAAAGPPASRAPAPAPGPPRPPRGPARARAPRSSASSSRAAIASASICCSAPGRPRRRVEPPRAPRSAPARERRPARPAPRARRARTGPRPARRRACRAAPRARPPGSRRSPSPRRASAPGPAPGRAPAEPDRGPVSPRAPAPRPLPCPASSAASRAAALLGLGLEHPSRSSAASRSLATTSRSARSWPSSAPPPPLPAAGRCSARRLERVHPRAGVLERTAERLRPRRRLGMLAAEGRQLVRAAGSARESASVRSASAAAVCCSSTSSVASRASKPAAAADAAPRPSSSDAASVARASSASASRCSSEASCGLEPRRLGGGSRAASCAASRSAESRGVDSTSARQAARAPRRARTPPRRAPRRDSATRLRAALARTRAPRPGSSSAAWILCSSARTGAPPPAGRGETRMSPGGLPATRGPPRAR